ncbi:MAG: hypothetical protein U1G07_03690 [Verrucomicrobiota bacterium]
MKASASILAGILVVVRGHGGDIIAGDSAAAELGAAQTQVDTTATGITRPLQVRVVVRGWEIQAATGMKRASLTRLLPDYRQRKLIGTTRTDLLPANGEFLLVLVQSKWATPQPPNDALWTGKPDVVLVDDQGTERPALDTLGWQSGDYLARGMGASARRRPLGQRVGQTSRQLVYFDIASSTGRTFWLRFSKDGPLVPVSRVLDLPQVDVSRLD